MATTVSRISPEELKRAIESKRDIVIVDVRQPEPYNSSSEKITGAIRIPPAEIENRYQELPKDKPIVLY